VFLRSQVAGEGARTAAANCVYSSIFSLIISQASPRPASRKSPIAVQSSGRLVFFQTIIVPHRGLPDSNAARRRYGM
jgi:hypothetical protein